MSDEAVLRAKTTVSDTEGHRVMTDVQLTEAVTILNVHACKG
jgi:hypothetical protein